ncbi:hypothetical protein [Streptomyces agglomeratus]|uniref:hypothetical protein n=1 Tax=Streptomyces agglomeratus TaxID=285458 RepID=UPI00114D1BEF|nr:hypothetical protein [Streptomyces agglomeratus]
MADSVWGAIGKGAGKATGDTIGVLAGALVGSYFGPKKVTVGLVNESEEVLYFCAYYPSVDESAGWRLLRSGENTGFTCGIPRRGSETFYLHGRTADGSFLWKGDFGFHAAFPLEGELQHENYSSLSTFKICGAAGGNPVIIAEESRNVGRPEKVKGIRVTISEDYTFRFRG